MPPFSFWSAFSASHKKGARRNSLASIGLTLVAIHIVGINVTGVSVNPARSLGPAIVGVGANPGAFGQVWLFIIAPLIGAGVAGLLFKSGGVLSAENA